ncbi:MAG: hypothetical protein ACKN9E_10920 [Microcystaceae cyanobacterium]
MIQWRNEGEQGQVLAIAPQQALEDLVNAELRAIITKTNSQTAIAP